jgi:hypothetical protein
MKKLFLFLVALLATSCGSIEPMTGFADVSTCRIEGCENSTIHHHAFLE